MLKLKLQYFWPPDVKIWLIGKDSDAGKDWRQEEKGTTEDEMVGWHYRLDGREFEQALGVGDGQVDLAWCSWWGCKKSDTTEWLNWTEETQKSGLNWAGKGSIGVVLYESVSGIAIYTLLILCIKHTPNENLFTVKGTSLSALWQPKWGGNPK